MGYAAARRTGVNYFERLDGYTNFAPPMVIMGHFKEDAIGNPNTYNGWLGVNRGSASFEQCYSIGITSPGGTPQIGTRNNSGGTSDNFDSGLDYTYGEWCFVALVITDGTTRQLYVQRQGDATLQGPFTGNTNDFTPTSIDSVTLGSRIPNSFTCDIDCFQLGIARSVISVANLQAAANGQAIETIPGISHAYPLLTDRDDAVGSVNFTDTGTVADVTDPFVPGSGGLSLEHTAGRITVDGKNHDLEFSTKIAMAAILDRITGNPIANEANIQYVFWDKAVWLANIAAGTVPAPALQGDALATDGSGVPTDIDATGVFSFGATLIGVGREPDGDVYDCDEFTVT